MKKTTRNFVLITVLFFIAASCGKTPVENTPPVIIPIERPLPIQIEKDGDFVNVNYNTNGTVQSIVTSEPTGNILANYVFTYENGKLKQIDFGGKWKYTYTGNNLAKIETFNQDGQLRYTYEFVYAGGKVVEKTEYLSVVNRNPKFRTKYTYRTDGNVEKAEVLQYINNDWMEAETIFYNQYDLYANVTDQFESYPYLPASMFSPNNPVKETWFSAGQQEQVVEHAYTYDALGRTKTKKSTYKFTGFPDTFSETKILY